MQWIRTALFSVLVISMLIACGEQEPLRNGQSFQLTSVSTAYDSYSDDKFYPWIKFRVTNNGTEPIETLHVLIEIYKPSGNLLDQTEFTVHNVDSRESYDYKFHTILGWDTETYYEIKDGGWEATYAIGISIDGGRMEVEREGSINFGIVDF